MAGRVSLQHDGFFVPNAQDVARPELAEPDRIDFNTVAHARWGVINGCLVTVTGSTATNTEGTALINGILVNVVGGQNVHVGAGGAQDRFDVVGVDTTGKLVGIGGSESTDPVFPDVPSNVTALAAVLCTAGGGSYTDNVIDKRKFLPDSLLTKIPAANELLANRNGTGNLYRLTGEGVTSWNDDTWLQRDSAGTLRVIANLKIDASLVVGTAVTAQTVTATGRVVGSNLRSGSSVPSPATGISGDLFAHTVDGSLYIFQEGAWKEMATVESAVPMGCVITSMQRPASMPPGWVPLDGNAQVFEATQPDLFALLDSWNWPRSGTAPNRVITTRDANRRVLLVDSNAPGTLGGSSTITIGLVNMPEHKHGVDVRPGGGYTPVVRINRVGGHRHAVTGGAHGHNDVPDPGHAHYGADHILGGGFICAAYGGRNKIDAYFNDRSHTYSVEMAEWTRLATTGITYIGSAGSEHQHEVSDAGDHDHTVGVDAVPEHDHNVNEAPVGNSQPLAFTPAYLAVYAYIKS
jgi:hypothetical protein